MPPRSSISENPPSGSVAHAATASDLAQIQVDVERNLKLWGVQEALRNGQFPSNNQLDGALRRLIRWCTVRDQAVSAEAEDVVASLRSLLEVARLVLREKNADELAQQTAWLVYDESRVGSDRSREAGAPAPAFDLERPPAPEPVLVDSDGESLASVESDTGAAQLDHEVDNIAEDQAAPDGQLVEGARHVRRLAVIFFTNPELRSAAAEVVMVFRDMVKSKTKEAGAPVAREGEPVEEPPEPQPPPVEAEVVAEPPQVAAEPPASELDRLFQAFHLGQYTKVDLSGSTPQPPGAYCSDPEEEDEFADAEEHLSGPAAGLGADPRVARCCEKLKLAILSLQEQEGYTAAMTWLLDVLELNERIRLRSGPAHIATPMERILTNIATLLERFARGRSLGPIQRAIHKMNAEAREDVTLQALWADIDAFCRTSLLEPGFVSSSTCDAQAESLWKRVSDRLDDEVSSAQWRLLSTSLSSWLGLDEDEDEPAPRLFPDDPVTRALSDRWEALSATLFLDARGKFQFKQQLYKDLWGLIAPTVKGIGYVPLPRVEFTSPAIELVLENIFISIDNLLPTVVTVKRRATDKWSPFKELEDACESSERRRVRVRIEQVQADVRGMRAALRLKKLDMADTAVVDVLLSRRGLSIDMDLEIDSTPNAAEILIPHDVSVSIDELSATVRDAASGHKFLYVVLLKLAIPLLKARMRNRLSLRLKEAIKRTSAEMVELRRRIGATRQDDMSRIVRIVLQRATELKHEAAANRALPRKNRWKFSSRIEEAIFPNTTQDGEKSIVYRRWREEERARLAALGPRTAARARLVTDAGLRGGVGEWRSTAFTFD